jgi:hypothetical protein
MENKLQDIQDSYIGYFGEEGGILKIGSDGYASDDFRGEVLFRGANHDNSIAVEHLNRFALFGRLPDNPDKGLYGVFSLVGPETQPDVKSGPDGGRIEHMSLNIHYEDLPLRRSTHIWVSEVEQMDTSLTWRQEVIDNDTVVWQNVKLSARLNLESTKKGAVEVIELELPQITFRKVGVEEPRGEPHKSILSHCGPPDSNCVAGTSVEECRLPVKFVDLTNNESLAAVEDLCNNLIIGVRDVWRNQVALDLTVWPNVEDYSDNPSPLLQEGCVDDSVPRDHRPSQVNLGSVAALKQFRDSVRIQDVAWGHIEVYLVDNLAGAAFVSGGTTVYPKMAAAFCVLQFDKAFNNHNLLAHDIGHVMGLDDNPPSAPGSLEASSAGSIMSNSTSNINTALHCIFLHASASANPIVKHTQVPDCCRPLA